jgi:integrase/recombinase XerC
MPRKLDADLLTAGEIERLMRACSNRAPTGIRNRALIAVAWRSGLRIGEVLALRSKDIDLDSGTLVVQHGKGDKRRVVGVDAGTAALLARWVDVRRKRGVDGRAPIFCTRDGGRCLKPATETGPWRHRVFSLSPSLAPRRRQVRGPSRSPLSM